MKHLLRNVKILFFYKLLAGFSILALIMILIFLKGMETVHDTSNLLEETITEKVSPLAKVNQLQSRANKIRLMEAELSEIDDFFAITGTVDNLIKESAQFEQELTHFVATFFPLFMNHTLTVTVSLV